MSSCGVRRSIAGPIAALQDDTYWFDQPSHQARPFRVEATWGAMTAKRRWAIGQHSGNWYGGARSGCGTFVEKRRPTATSALPPNVLQNAG
jgi:hypothetical protein